MSRIIKSFSNNGGAYTSLCDTPSLLIINDFQHDKNKTVGEALTVDFIGKKNMLQGYMQKNCTKGLATHPARIGEEP